jgi:hypothetical protein
MADSVRLVDYFYVTVPDKAGEGARLLDALRQDGVNLLAFSAFPEGRKSQADFIPEDSAAFRRVAKKAKWKLTGPKKVFLLQGDDRVGLLADIVRSLAGAKINITALDAISVHGRYGALLWVAPKDLKKAQKALESRQAASVDAVAAALATLGP